VLNSENYDLSEIKRSLGLLFWVPNALKRGFLLLSLFGLIALASNGHSAQLPEILAPLLPENLSTAMQQANLTPDNFAFTVIPVSSNTSLTSTNSKVKIPQNSLLELHAFQLMNPASTMKLVSSFIALDELGPQFQWRTQILHQQPIKNGVLEGDLYLRGGGDPNFTWDKLAGMLRKLRQLGLHEIRGNIVLDRSYFSPERPDQTGQDFDQHPTAYYNVIPDALLVHSNLVSFTIDSDHKK